jgi:hypothetical protein
MTYFRTCSTCRSRSQAPLCLCTRRLVSNQAEGTFGRLRYFLGGDRPSQTTHQTLSLTRITGSRLGPKLPGWYFKDDSTEAGARLQSLPPILHNVTQESCQAIVKVHGVFPSSAGNGIFTVIQFRRGPWLRQWEVVTPFVQVGTYPTRNFATLGPL